MAELHDVTGVCPVCGETMVVTRLSCPHCDSALEGAFRVVPPGGAVPRSAPPGTRRDDARFGRLARLDETQLEFVETFVRCRGVIKNVEDMLGISYPTVKTRLANVLDTMGYGDEETAAEWRRMRRAILADLTAGRINIDQAHQLLRGNPRASDDDSDDEDSDTDDDDSDGEDTANDQEGKA